MKSYTKAWRMLNEHKIASRFYLRRLFRNTNRFEEFSLKFNDILYDYSKNLIDKRTLDLLILLANDSQLSEYIEKMFSGEKINFTEKRAVLHVALRNRSNSPILVDGQDFMPEVNDTLKRIGIFSEAVRNGELRGYTGKEFTDIVNIGIGGSDLGPEMVCKALRPYGHPRLRCHFLSNIDGNHIDAILSQVNPETTLFIVASKTFTTQETLTNASSAKSWFVSQIQDSNQHQEAISKHFIAISTNEVEVTKFGIDKNNMFPFWDWVGGRFSVWSAIGMSIAIYIGFENFEQFLTGAHEADQHFRTSELSQNIPVLMGLLGVWYTNFYNAQTHAILPYSQDMSRFAAYFQQGEMESNGKYVDRDGKPVRRSTAPVIWGEPGTNSQHSFFQLLHQGTHFIPCDFLVSVNCHHNFKEHHKILLSNFCAQTEALAFGKTRKEVYSEYEQGKLTEEQIPHRTFQGNRPSSSFVFALLTPKTLGTLMAFYEHKIFTQGVIWRINSFDQWGVELGKALAKSILEDLNSESNKNPHDNSTEGILNYIRQLQD